MKLKKIAAQYDTYSLEVSFKELMAIQAAGQNSGDPVADENSKAISWFLSNEVPPPGVDEHPSKAAKEAGASSEEVDAILPASEGEFGAPEGVPPSEGPAPESPAEIETSLVPAGAPGGEDEEIEAEEILPRD